MTGGTGDGDTLCLPVNGPHLQEEGGGGTTGGTGDGDTLCLPVNWPHYQEEGGWMCNRWDRWWWHSLFTCKLATPPGGRGLEVRQVGQVMVTWDSLWLPSSSSGGWKNQWILMSLICVSAVLGFMFQHQQKLHTDMRVKHEHCKYARDTDETQTLQTCTRYRRNTNTANMHEIQTKHKHCKHARDTDETLTLQTCTRYRRYTNTANMHEIQTIH